MSKKKQDKQTKRVMAQATAEAAAARSAVLLGAISADLAELRSRVRALEERMPSANHELAGKP